MDYKEKVIALLNSQELSKEQKEKLENIFPELKENEDERMRKALKQGFFHYGNSFTTFGGINVVDIIAWLEKQGEQESIDYNEELKKCRENPLYFIDKYVKFEERKPAWSKEDERIRKEIIDFLRLPHPQFVGKRDHEKWIDWLEKQCDNKECGDEWEVSTGLYKCTKRMFDGTPESRLLFEPGNLYKCIKIHKCVTNNDVAVFESPYWQPVFLTDSIVRKHFIKV